MPLDARVGVDGLELRRQLSDDGFELRGVERADRLAERAEAEPLDAELLADLVDRAGLLEGADRVEDRVEQGEQHERDVLVEVQPAVAGRVAVAADVAEGCEQREEVAQPLEALDLPRVDDRVDDRVVLARLGGHARRIMPDPAPGAQAQFNAILLFAIKRRAEQDW